MQQLITSRGSGRWEIVALCTENFQTRSSSYTYHVEGVGWKMSLVPVSSWITLKFVQEDVSLSLFKKRERDREKPVVVEWCHPSLLHPRVREDSYVSSTLFSTVPKMYVRYVSYIRGWEGTRVAASTWPAIGLGGKTPLSYGTADRIRRRCPTIISRGSRERLETFF